MSNDNVVAFRVTVESLDEVNVPERWAGTRPTGSRPVGSRPSGTRPGTHRPVRR
jgi:hypothetical protein